MAYDAARFREVYLPVGAPAFVHEGWRITSVEADRVRAAIDLRLEASDGRALIVFVERRVEGGVCFATTDRLQISYYKEDAGGSPLSDAEAATATRGVVEHLRSVEKNTAAETLDDALRVPSQGPSSSEAGFQFAGPARRSLELRINRECNEACLFCNTPEESDAILPGSEAILGALRSERRAGYEHVTFTGREPTLDPALPSYLREARRLGYDTIRVQTNGTSFASGPLLPSLTEAGMNTAEISLHTLEVETFARLVGKPALLDKTLRGLERLALETDVRVHLVVVLTRLNLSHLSAVLERAAKVHPRLAQVTVSVMAPVGDGARQLALIPRLEELRQPLADAFEVARERGLTVRIPSRCGTPLCAMPPGTESFNDELHNPLGRTLEAGKSKAAACARCRWEPRCTGIWTACLERWGEEVVMPVESEEGGC